MPALPDLVPAWATLSRLLDEALALPAGQRQAWLDALPAEHAPLRDTLAQLLAAPPGLETRELLHTLPKLQAVPAEARAGLVVGPWKLLRELGEGGMGSVWLAERADGSLRRQVALKLPRWSWARGLQARMDRERDILATLEHPHIARLYDAGVDTAGRPWLALEHVQGSAIDRHARERGLGVRERVQLLLQVCEAVAFAHGRLVIHRDIKPANVLVTDDGQVKLLDFGIAKLAEPDGVAAAGTALTELQGRALTPDFASPEQLRGQPLTTASDVYSLGVLSYGLLAGAPPYRLPRADAQLLEATLATVPRASETAARHGAGTAAARALRGGLDAIVGHAMAADPARRYAAVSAFADDLRRHLQGLPPSVRPDTGLSQAARWLWRHRIGTGLAGGLALLLLAGAHAQLAAALALVAGTAMALWQAARSRQAAERALAQSARADAMQRFVLDLFRRNSLQQPDPLRAQATSARELLELGAERLLDGEAGWSPALRGELLDAVFELINPLHLSALGERLAEQRVALREQLHGAGSAAALQARADLAEVRLTMSERAAGNRAELDRLCAAVASGPLRGSELHGRVERLLSQAWVTLDLARSLAHSDRAVALLVPGSLAWAEACTDRVMPLLRAERTAEAERAAEGAVAALRGSGHDEALARAIVELAEARAMMRRHDEAEALFLEALRLRERRLGRGHPSTLYLLGKYATAQRAAGRWAQAEQSAAEGIARCVEALGPGETHYMAMLRVERGRCLVLLGRFADARTELDAALECLDATGERHFGHAAALLALATAHLGQGELDASEARLDEVEQLLSGLGFAPGSANQDFVALLRADLALARQDPDACDRALALVGPVRDDDPGSPMRAKGLRMAAQRTDAARLRGDPSQALTHLEALLAPLLAPWHPPAPPGVPAIGAGAVAVTPGIVASALDAQARALLAVGRHTDARAAADRAVALRAAHEAAESGPLAASRALAQRCRPP